MTIQNNVLIIGDLHCPFEKEGYLEFCLQQYNLFGCTKVVFIGDLIDNHYSSYHEANPDGFSAGEELDRAIARVDKWYKAFPNATVIIGNHDRIITRKAFSAGLSSRWVREYKEVLNTPTWDFVESIEIDGVMYVHGEGGTARTRVKSEGQSIVQGHLHSQAYVEWNNNKIFGMQVGCGIDDTQFAFAYAKAGKKSIISCGVVLGGKTPLLLKM